MWVNATSLGFIRVEKRREKTRTAFFLKRTRKTEESVWSEMKGALGWEQLAQKAGGWQRVKIIGSDQAFIFFATLRL